MMWSYSCLFLSFFLSMCLFCMETAIAHGSIYRFANSVHLSFSLSIYQTHRHLSPYGFSLKPKFLQYYTDFDWLQFNSSGTSSPTISLVFCFYMLFFVLGFGWIELLWFLILSWLLYAFCSINANFFALLCMFNCSSSDFWYCFMWVLICFHAILIFSELGLFFMSVISF